VRFVDRYLLFFSKGKRIDGLWVGRIIGEPEAIRPVDDALRLIKTHDPIRYARLIRDVDRVWVRLLPGPIASFNLSLGACELDERFVLAETSTPELIAATIVHEATHARLMRCGIGYEEKLRARVESVCQRRELAFAAKLPNGERVAAETRQRMAGCTAEFWTNAAFSNRFDEGSVEALRHLGVPEWAIRAIFIFRTLLSGPILLGRRLRRFFSRA
jgi:hypothetical protein